MSLPLASKERGEKRVGFIIAARAQVGAAPVLRI
jgi:hypothetical protein